MTPTRGEVRPLDGVRAIGYRRVSTEQQAGDDKSSLADQRAAIEAMAAKLGVTVGAWFDDEGYSGSTVDKRPALQSLIASCVAHGRPKSSPGYVIALNDSRWGRFPDPEESGYWRFHIAQFSWIVRFAEGDDIQDGFARSIVRLAGAGQASEYRRNIIQNTIRGSRNTTVSGWWKGGDPPIGFARQVVYPPGREQRILPHGVRKAADEHVALIPDPTDAAFVRRLFELYADGTVALHGLAELAHQERPGRNWNSGALYYLLRNPIYLGHLRSKKAQTAEPYRRDDAHPPIVSQELFDRVGARLKANRRVRRGTNRSYPVTGLILCSACGFPLTGSGANAKGVRYYRCNGLRAVANPCSRSGSVIAAHRLERAVYDLLAGEFRRAESRAVIRRHIDRYVDTLAAQPIAPATDAFDRAITTLEAQRHRLVSALANGVLTESDAGAQMRDLRVKLDRAQADRATALRFADRRAAAPVDRQRLYRMVEAMPALLHTLTGPELRGAVVPWLRSATFDRTEKRLTLEIRRVPVVAAGGVSLDPLSQLEQNHTLPYVTRTVALGRSK